MPRSFAGTHLMPIRRPLGNPRRFFGVIQPGPQPVQHTHAHRHTTGSRALTRLREPSCRYFAISNVFQICLSAVAILFAAVSFLQCAKDGIFVTHIYIYYTTIHILHLSVLIFLFLVFDRGWLENPPGCLLYLSLVYGRNSFARHTVQSVTHSFTWRFIFTETLVWLGPGWLVGEGRMARFIGLLFFFPLVILDPGGRARRRTI